MDLLLQWVRCSNAAAAQAEDRGDLRVREEGAAGKSRGAKIIQEMKLSQQGFLPI